MGEIRHGKIHLRWCDACEVPVMEQASCGRCGGRTREVKVTPPGDARPAFDRDIAHIRTLVDSQFGEGSGVAVIPDGVIVLLNKAPDIDRMDEVVVGGDVVGAVRFNMVNGEKFLPRPRGTLAIAKVATKGRVVVDPGAIIPIRTKKASTLAVGVLKCDEGVVPGDDIIVVSPEGGPVSVGSAKMSAEQMMRGERGTAVKTRWVVDEGLQAKEPKPATWGDAISASRETMARREDEAKRFVKEVVSENDLPVAVSYSGGKDSLATLLLVLDSGVRPKLMFVDTGLEFRETRENCRADRAGLRARGRFGGRRRLLLEERRALRATGEGLPVVLQDVQAGTGHEAHPEGVPSRGPLVHRAEGVRVGAEGGEGPHLEEPLDARTARRITHPEMDRDARMALPHGEGGAREPALRHGIREDRMLHVSRGRPRGAQPREGARG